MPVTTHSAKVLGVVKGLDSNLSKDLALTSLTNNIGQAIYKDIEQLEQMCRRMPMLKAAKELEYGFMVLDKADPTSMMKPPSDKVYVIPPEEETRMPAQKAAEGFQAAADKVKKMLGSA